MKGTQTSTCNVKLNFSSLHECLASYNPHDTYSSTQADAGQSICRGLMLHPSSLQVLLCLNVIERR